MRLVIRTLEPLIELWLMSMQQRQFSAETIESDKYILRKFQNWCEERELARLSEISPQVLDAYQRWVFHYRTSENKALSVSRQKNLLGRLIQCLRWGHQQGYLLIDPTTYLVLPKVPKHLPSSMLSRDELEQLMKQPDLSNPLGLRDRALLEVFYSTAIRHGEARNLCLGDIDRAKEYLWVRQGKGRKDRVVPISARAIEWIDRYEVHGRPQLMRFSSAHNGNNYLFISCRGKVMCQGTTNERVTKYIRSVAPEKKGSCHLIRHSVATLLLENGCSIRYIQELLGHSHLKTAQIYTRISPQHLQKAYELYHPIA